MESPRSIHMFNKTKDLWTDSETDLSSSASDNDSVRISRLSSSVKTPINKNDRSPELKCCLICSVLPALSNINCCPKHLALLTKTFPSALPAQIIYMMPPTVNSECHCQSHCSRSKRQDRSRSSSSSFHSSSRKKKRSVTVESSNTIDDGDLLLSPNIERTKSPNTVSRETPTIHRSNHVRTPLSPAFQPFSAINTNMHNNNNNNNNCSRRQNRISSAPIATRNTYRKKSTGQNQSAQTNSQTTSPELIELDSNLSSSPRILLKRIVYVKDDDEELPTSNSQITLNMHRATEQMVIQRDAQPKILLKRVTLEK